VLNLLGGEALLNIRLIMVEPVRSKVLTSDDIAGWQNGRVEVLGVAHYPFVVLLHREDVVLDVPQLYDALRNREVGLDATGFENILKMALADREAGPALELVPSRCSLVLLVESDERA
jgi:hypothetical protein